MPESEKSYLTFTRTADSPSGKTMTWDVRTKEGIGDRLGFVKWFGRWRCYAFYPVWSGTIFEKKCLRDIANFCEARTKEHRSKA